MEYRTLGKTGFKISEVSLGTWQLGGKWGEEFNQETARKILEKAVEMGINFIDTADVYNDGQSEIAIGRFLKKVKNRVYVATKCGRRLDPHTAEGYNEKNITGFVEDSLKRLDVEAIDLIQLHCPPTEVYHRQEAFESLAKLKTAGKILNYGVSVEKIEEALKAIEQPGVATVQIIYNIFRQRPAEEFFKQAYSGNVGIIVRVPLASGLLTGKFTKDTVFGNKDHRNYNIGGKYFDKGETFAGVPYDIGIEAVDRLKEIFGQNNITAYALKWVILNEYVSCVIPGASSVEQVEFNSKVSDMMQLTAEQLRQTEEVYEKYIKKHVHHLW
jgi:aryl-alcohol dehydrogenase-like predicted oxidoreductase